MRKYRQVQTNTTLEPGPRRVLTSLGQDSSPAARTATTYTWAKGGARRHRGIRAVAFTMRGGVYHARCSTAQGLAQQQQQQPRKQEISPYCLIPSCHIWSNTVVLPAAEPKEPLTLVRPCVRCCSALWAWGCTAVRFVREAKAPRWADCFVAKGSWRPVAAVLFLLMLRSEQLFAVT